MNMLLPYATVLLLGSMHALEADHMAAVTAFTVRKPAPLAAAGFGIRWAAGHGAAVVGAGLLLLLIGITIPDHASGWLDRGVGVVLIALGVWTAWHASQLHAHTHKLGNSVHAHLHPHKPGNRHAHSHAPALVGLLHGLAGAAPAVAMLQIARTDSLMQGMAYLVTFAIGTAAGMALYALATGFLMGRAAIAGERWARILGKCTGVGTITIGVFWLFR